MCPFSKTIRENQTVRETYQGFAESNGSGGISLAVGGVWGSSDDDQRLEAGACAARKQLRRTLRERAANEDQGTG